MEITPEQLRSIQLKELEALIEIDRICRKHGLRYYLTYGTLLGAVRHKGFIPWDDDLDITMPRKDYETFLKNSPEWLDKRFFVQNYRTTPQCSGQISEIRINGTILRQKMSEHSQIHHGIYIDVFPLDYIHPDTAKRRIDRLLLRALITMCYAKTGHYSTHNPLFKFASKALSTLFPLAWLRQTTENLSCRYEKNPTGFVCSPLSPYALCSTTKEVFPEEFFGEPQEIEFEGRRFFAPANPDAILRQIYGDYMEPPPPDQRALRHHIVDLQI